MEIDSLNNCNDKAAVAEPVKCGSGDVKVKYFSFFPLAVCFVVFTQRPVMELIARIVFALPTLVMNM